MAKTKSACDGMTNFVVELLNQPIKYAIFINVKNVGACLHELTGHAF
jgi:hypothetical protein